MIIYPAIDLQKGQCVRLKQGDFNQSKIYSDNPGAIAETFKQAGAEWIHVVDLDGAKNGTITQLDVIENIAQQFTGNVQAGGGVRQREDVEKLLAIGAKRIIVGSICISDPEKVSDWLNDFRPENLVLALDFRMKNNEPYLAVSGWQENTDTLLWDVIENTPLAMHVLCTDISLDGMQQGPNFDFYQQFVERYPHIHLQASGGIRNLSDIQALDAVGANGCIIGKALYEGNVRLEEALRC